MDLSRYVCQRFSWFAIGCCMVWLGAGIWMHSTDAIVASAMVLAAAGALMLLSEFVD